MPTHWTYEAFDLDDDLQQGDILEPERLQSLLEKVHPHFLDPKYVAFLLITQSCDMAVRKGKCSARYLNIAVVRPLDAVLYDFLNHVCGQVVEGVYLKETKGEANRLLERLFNQNEQTLGLFYLHPDKDTCIPSPSVALLRITVTVRAEHYGVLQSARRGKLCSEFRSKLGWLVGNLYSRIGTQDWSDSAERTEELRRLVKQYLEDASYGPTWVPGSWVAAAREKGIQIEQMKPDELSATLQAHRPPAAKNQIIDQALIALKEVMPAADDDLVRRLRNRLNNDSLFAKAVRRAAVE